MTDQTPSEVTHLCPPGDEGWTPCCDRTPFELPRTDRITEDVSLVTCGGETAQREREEANRG